MRTATTKQMLSKPCPSNCQRLDTTHAFLLVLKGEMMGRDALMALGMPRNFSLQLPTGSLTKVALHGIENACGLQLAWSSNLELFSPTAHRGQTRVALHGVKKGTMFVNFMGLKLKKKIACKHGWATWQDSGSIAVQASVILSLSSQLQQLWSKSAAETVSSWQP